MTDALIPVFIDGQAAFVEPATPAREAVIGIDPALGTMLEDGRAYLTDGRGIRLDPVAPLSAGAIVRVIRSARNRETPA